MEGHTDRPRQLQADDAGRGPPGSAQRFQACCEPFARAVSARLVHPATACRSHPNALVLARYTVGVPEQTEHLQQRLKRAIVIPTNQTRLSVGAEDHGMQEVVGSIPIGSTLKTPDASSGFFCGNMLRFCFQIDMLRACIDRIDGTDQSVDSGGRVCFGSVRPVALDRSDGAEGFGGIVGGLRLRFRFGRIGLFGRPMRCFSGGHRLG